MSHRKVYSQGSIPFSWEDSPGVSKLIHQKLPINHDHLGLNNATNVSSPMCLLPRDSDYSSKDLADDHQLRKIPLPPCPKVEAPLPRSASVKGTFRWWQEDPFLAAYKECTKNVRNNGKLSNESKKSSVGSKVKKSRLIFSCKNSCDVQDESLVIRLSNLPPIPRDRVRAR